MIMYFFQKTRLTAMLLILLIVASCSSSNTEKKEDNIQDTLSSKPKKENIAEQDDYVLPSVAQIATIFKKAGLKYYDGITNDTKNITKYETGNTFSQAINLGVYSADLSYTILNAQAEQTKKYFKCCKQLANKLGFVQAFETNGITQRIEKNINHQDSVINILSGIQSDIDNVLQSEDKEYISVIAFSGAWIESMYIASQVYKKSATDKKITSQIIEQILIAENLIKALKASEKKDASIISLIKDIQQIDNLCNSLQTIKNIKSSDLDVVDPSSFNISKEEIELLTKNIEEIRTRFINY